MGLRDFKILKKAGKGAFGDVFKVVRKDDNVVYALKKVGIGSMSKKEVEDALNEIRFLASLRHPSIIGFLEAFYEPRGMHLCMILEWAGEGDLSQKIEEYRKQRKYIPEQQIWDWFIQLVEGVNCLHDNRVCHRDLKTANSAPEGTVKVGDLNVSKLAKHGLLRTQIGTPYYMSPEIWKNKPYNTKSDMWALGCILYELACLRVPFRGRDFEELSKRVQSGVYHPIPSRYGGQLAAVIRKLLHLNPSRRPSARELLKSTELQEWRGRSQFLRLHPIAPAPSERQSLLATIKCPREMRGLSRNLPKACYPDQRPDSPECWPVTARDRDGDPSRPSSHTEPVLKKKPDLLVHVAPSPKKRHRPAPSDAGSVRSRRSNASNASGVIPPRYVSRYNKIPVLPMLKEVAGEDSGRRIPRHHHIRKEGLMSPVLGYIKPHRSPNKFPAVAVVREKRRHVKKPSSHYGQQWGGAARGGHRHGGGGGQGYASNVRYGVPSWWG